VAPAAGDPHPGAGARPLHPWSRGGRELGRQRHVRAGVEDFAGWADAVGDGWSYEECLPALNALEDDLDFGDADYHGTGGPIPISRPRREHFSALDAVVDTITDRFGHPWCEDHNAPGTTGVSPYAYNGRAGRRVSTNDGYLEPARARTNLRIVGDAQVDRVLVSRGRATGVRAVIAGGVRDLGADEVVVAAGAIHTPAVLQRSGVGPSALLRRLGIEVVADLPTGLGLQEHPGIALELGLREPADYRGQPQRGQVCARFTSGVGGEHNDLMIAVVGALGIGLPYAGIAGWVNRVTSTGAVSITSTDATVDPRVDFDLLSTDDDLDRFRVVVEELRRIASQPELRELVTDMQLGGIAPDVTLDRGEFRAWALANVQDTVHGTSTCRMGRPGDADVVVDPHGRVVGVEGLRVADTSILPWTTRANTNLTAILVGERVAQLMRQEPRG
jgi:choline dehydrogenase